MENLFVLQGNWLKFEIWWATVLKLILVCKYLSTDLNFFRMEREACAEHSDTVWATSLCELRHKKTCLQGVQPGNTQTSLLSWWD